MKKLLAATDFSPAALNATEYATDMALASNADLKVLHIFQVPVSYNELPVIMVDEDFMARAESRMNELKEQLNLRVNNKIKIETEVRMGFFYEALIDVCKRMDPYAVIIGSQGKTAAERLLFGGHAVHAMKHLPWPLITVPSMARYSGVKKIGLACEFADVVKTTPVDEVKRLIKDFNAELHILNTGKSNEFSPEIIFESGLMQEMLNNIKPSYHFITSEDTDEGIIDFVEKNHIDLLIVLPKRHGFIDTLLHKSHTKQFVLHSHVPVMALHE